MKVTASLLIPFEEALDNQIFLMFLESQREILGGKGLNKQPRDLKHIKISITETLLGFVKYKFRKKMILCNTALK